MTDLLPPTRRTRNAGRPATTQTSQLGRTSSAAEWKTSCDGNARTGTRAHLRGQSQRCGDDDACCDVPATSSAAGLRRRNVCSRPRATVAIHFSSRFTSPRVLPAVVRILRQTALDDVIERRRRQRLARRDRRRRVLQDRADERSPGSCPRRAAARSPSRRARRRAPRCRCARRPRALRLLGRHVLDRAEDRARRGRRRRRSSSLSMADIEIGTAGRVSFARPKSSSFAPVFVSMMLPGLRSRWTMPARCALSSASAISIADTAAPGRAAADAFRASAARPASRPRDTPSRGSRCSSCRPTSWSGQMCGW